MSTRSINKKKSYIATKIYISDKTDRYYKGIDKRKPIVQSSYNQSYKQTVIPSRRRDPVEV